MATTTRSRLRAILAGADGFFYSGSLTSIGGAGGATLVDTGIARYNRNQMPDRWALLTSGAISGESQRISTVSDDAVGTITPVRVFTAQVASGVTYEILPFDPLDAHRALQEAGRLINAYSPLSLLDETLIVDNLVLNPLFATFAAGAFTNWTSIGGPTISQNTSYFWYRTQSANIAPAAANEGLEQNLLTAANGFGRIDQAVGKTLHARAALRATNADNARLRVTFNGTTYTSSSFHSGDDDWEGPGVHQVDVAIPASLTEMTVSVEAATTTAFQGGMVVAWIDPIYRYTVPTTFVFPSPLRVSQQDDETRPNGDYRRLSLSHPPIPGRILRLEGPGRLTVPTTDTGTVELDEAASELLVALAGRILHRTLKNVGFGPSERHLQNELDWRQEVQELVAARGLNKPQELITVNRSNPWEIKDESGTSYLYLKDR